MNEELEVEFVWDFETYEDNKRNKFAIWFGAIVVTSALFVNVCGPTFQTLASERIVETQQNTHEYIQKFSPLKEHVLPGNSIGIILQVALPTSVDIAYAIVNDTIYTFQSGYDSYHIQMQAPNEVGDFLITLQALGIINGDLQTEVAVNQTLHIGVEEHIPHFDEVHPEKPKVETSHDDAQLSDDTHDDPIAKNKSANKLKFHQLNKSNSHHIDKYALLDDRQLLKKQMKLSKIKIPHLSDHGSIVGVFIFDTLYPAKVDRDGSVHVLGLPSSIRTPQIQYFVYEDGYITPIG